MNFRRTRCIYCLEPLIHSQCSSSDPCFMWSAVRPARIGRFGILLSITTYAAKTYGQKLVPFFSEYYVTSDDSVYMDFKWKR